MQSPLGSTPDLAVPDDATLVQRCRAGDAQAWQALVNRYQRLVLAQARQAGLDETLTADVFQTVFLRLLQHLSRLHQPQGLQAWVMTTARREAWLQRKRSRQWVSMSDTVHEGDDEAGETIDRATQIADGGPGPEDSLAHWQQLAQVQRGLEQLDGACRRLLQALFGDEAAAYANVAARLNMPVGSIGPSRARCLAKLRRLVE